MSAALFGWCCQRERQESLALKAPNRSKGDGEARTYVHHAGKGRRLFLCCAEFTCIKMQMFAGLSEKKMAISPCGDVTKGADTSKPIVVSTL